MAQKAHLIGICGTGMGSLALLLRESGWQVRGSDAAPSPPMSTVLADRNIPVARGFSPEHLDWGPDLVVVGNIARPDNPEALEAERREIPVTSMAAAVADHFLAARHPVVVAGTHGKTTTTALLAWSLEAAGRRPGFLLGGVIASLEMSAQVGEGETFIIEGDEYDNAFFDKGPKFLHYRPRTAVLTSVEHDHIEIFPDLAAVQDAFRRFVSLLPADGRLVACADDPHVRDIAAACPAPVRFYGLGKDHPCGGVATRVGVESTAFDVWRDGRLFGSFTSPLAGDHNLRNMLATVEIMAGLGLSADQIAMGLASFPGVHRRQEMLGEVDGILAMDDFAHHPTAVRETVAAIRKRFPDRRLTAVFEPRTNSSRRALFQEQYAGSFGDADRVVIAAVHNAAGTPDGDRLDPGSLVASLRNRGTDATHIDDSREILEHLLQSCRSGDVVLFMSNGPFDGLPRRFVTALEGRDPITQVPV